MTCRKFGEWVKGANPLGDYVSIEHAYSNEECFSLDLQGNISIYFVNKNNSRIILHVS
jgi:hypothetical protein